MSIKALGKKVALTLQAATMALGFSAFSIAAVTVSSTPAFAAQGDCSTSDLTLQSGASCAQANGTKDDLFANGGIFQTIANTLIFLVGAIAVLFMIVGGLRYVVSNGDAKAVEGAKNTILYAIVGIVVAVLSFAAVNFVIQALNK